MSAHHPRPFDSAAALREPQKTGYRMAGDGEADWSSRMNELGIDAPER